MWKKNSILIQLRTLRDYLCSNNYSSIPLFPRLPVFLEKGEKKGNGALVQTKAKRMLQKHLPKWGSLHVFWHLLSLS